MNTNRIQPIDSAFFSNQDAERVVTENGKRPVVTIESLTPSRGSVVPSKRGGATLTQVNDGKVYLIGGANREAKSFGDVHAFDLVTKKWECVVPSRGSLPPRSGHSTVALGSELVVFGGFNAREGVVYNDIHVFDTETRTWAQVVAEGDAPMPRNAHVAMLSPPTLLTAIDRRQHAMLVFGGSSPHHGAFDDAFLLHLDGTDAIDGDTARRQFRWEKLSCSGEQPEARELHCGVRVADSSLCFLGGRNQHGNMCTDMAYLDTKTWTWQVVPMCGWARCSHAAGLVDGVLTSFGGFDGTSVCGDCWQFCEQVDEWRPATTAADQAEHQTVPERFGHCGATVVVITSFLDSVIGNISSSEKTAGKSDKHSNNTDLPTTRALLVFGGMNAETDLNDLALVTQQR